MLSTNIDEKKKKKPSFQSESFAWFPNTEIIWVTQKYMTHFSIVELI